MDFFNIQNNFRKFDYQKGEKEIKQPGIKPENNDENKITENTPNNPLYWQNAKGIVSFCGREDDIDYKEKIKTKFTKEEF